MTAWPYGLWRMVLRPEGSGGRVSSWVGAGEAECEGRRRGASWPGPVVWRSDLLFMPALGESAE